MKNLKFETGDNVEIIAVHNQCYRGIILRYDLDFVEILDVNRFPIRIMYPHIISVKRRKTW